jgi:hypothetical protein
MKVIYLSVIAGLTICFAFSAQAGRGSRGSHRSHQQFHLHGQHYRGRERSHTHGNVMKHQRERVFEKPNGVVGEQRQEDRTNGAGDTQTGSQEGTTQPNP